MDDESLWVIIPWNSRNTTTTKSISLSPIQRSLHKLYNIYYIWCIHYLLHNLYDIIMFRRSIFWYRWDRTFSFDDLYPLTRENRNWNSDPTYNTFYVIRKRSMYNVVLFRHHLPINCVRKFIFLRDYVMIIVT